MFPVTFKIEYIYLTSFQVYIPLYNRDDVFPIVTLLGLSQCTFFFKINIKVNTIQSFSGIHYTTI